MIGSLIYLVTCTCLDLGFVVSFLSGFSSHSLLCHHTAAKRVFRYLAGTRTTSLVYTRRSSVNIPLLITSYFDANYTSCHDTRHSVSGYIFLLNSCSISWLSKKQNSVSTFTTESEYMCKESIISTIPYLVLSVYFLLFTSFLQRYNYVMT